MGTADWPSRSHVANTGPSDPDAGIPATDPAGRILSVARCARPLDCSVLGVDKSLSVWKTFEGGLSFESLRSMRRPPKKSKLALPRCCVVVAGCRDI